MWGWLAFLVGIAYGFVKPGRQDKMQILKTGLLVGIALAIVFALIGAAVSFNPLGYGGTGLVGTFIAFVIMTVVFIIGVVIGDWLEGLRSPGMRRTV
jgi:cation transporter-like permease